MRKCIPNIRSNKKPNEKRSGFYTRKQIHLTEIRKFYIEGNLLITKKNHFEIEIWEKVKKVLLFHFSFSHPARKIQIINGILLVQSMVGQTTGCCLDENKTQTELINYNPPAKLHKKLITYIDHYNVIYTCNMQTGTIKKLHKRCLILMILKKRIRIR